MPQDSIKTRLRNYNSPTIAERLSQARGLRESTAFVISVDPKKTKMVRSRESSPNRDDVLQEILRATNLLGSKIEALTIENAELRGQVAEVSNRLDTTERVNQDRENRVARNGPDNAQGNGQVEPRGANDDNRPPGRGVNGEGIRENAPPIVAPIRPVHRRELRFMNFTKSDPEGWFASFEKLMGTRGIEEDTEKFDTLTAHIGYDVLKPLFGFIQDLGADNQYASLKRELIRRHGLSTEEKLARLFKETSLEGRRPSEMLNEMLRHAGNNIARETVVLWWRKLLPPSIQISILNDDDETAVGHADRVQEITMLETASNSTAKASETTVKDLMAEVGRLRQELRKSMTPSNRGAGNYTPQASKPPVNRNSQGGTEQPALNKSERTYPAADKAGANNAKNRTVLGKNRSDKLYDGYCYAHHQFGGQARNCNDKCKRYQEFTSKRDASGN